MKPKKQLLLDQLKRQYYPTLDHENEQLPHGQLPTCQFPAVYLMTRTVKVYKAFMSDPNNNTEVVDGKETELPDVEIVNDFVNIIGARFLCIQCSRTYESLSDLKRHLKLPAKE